MKVLFVCGAQTQNIKEGLDNVATKGLIRTDALKNIGEIDNYLKNGNMFERLVISDKSFITGINTIEPKRVRDDIIEVNKILHINGIYSDVIFITENEDIASIIEEEMYESDRDYKIVLHKGKYALKFFVHIATAEMDKIETGLDLTQGYASVVKKPTVVETNEEDEISEIVVEEQKEQEMSRVYQEIEGVEAGRGDIEFESDRVESEYEENKRSEEIEMTTVPDDWWEEEDKEEALSEVQEQEEEIEEIQEFESALDDSMYEEIEEEVAEEFEEEEIQPEELKVDDLKDKEEMIVDELKEVEVVEEVADIEEEVVVEVEEDAFEKKTEEDEGIESEGYKIDSLKDGIEHYEEPKEEQQEWTTREVLSDEDYVDVATEQPKQKPKAKKKVPENKEEKKKGWFSGLMGKDKSRGTDRVTGKRVQREESKEDYIEHDLDEKFGDDMYENNESLYDIRGISSSELDRLKKMLAELAMRRATYVFTGAQGSGSTTLAYCVAGEIARLGYSVLLVDADIKDRSLSYASKDIYDAMNFSDESSSALVKALYNPLKVDSYTAILSPGFHLLTLGLNYDANSISKIVTPQAFTKFTSIVKDKYNFIIIDIPFEELLAVGVDTGYIADRILLTTDSTTNGLLKTLIRMTNIPDEQARALMFGKSRIILNKYVKGNILMDKKAKRDMDILTKMDTIVEDVTGYDSEFKFRDLKISGTIPYNEKLANFWMSRFEPYNDAEITDIILRMLEEVLCSDRY